MSTPKRRQHRYLWERWFVEPVYFWLDLYGADGRPSHRKTLTAWGFFLALGAEVWWATKANSLADINWPYIALVIATLSMAFGAKTFNRVLQMRQRNGGADHGRGPEDRRSPGEGMEGP